MTQTGFKFILLSLLFFFLTHIPGQAQVVGGRGDNQASPKEVKAAELSKGAYTSDVNLFSGTMNTSYDLGTVSTFSGLKFNLQLSYSSTKTLGGTPMVLNGIPYGDGWNLNLPTISVSVANFQKYTSGQLPAYLSGVNSSDPQFSEADIIKEGSLYWFAPMISIPGVVSDRFIFKNYDAVSQESIFTANVMDHYVEARFTGSAWRVTNDNGDVYEFRSVVTNYRSASNLRFDGHDTISMSSNLVPKEEPMTWLCNDIYNKNHPLNQKISFNYYTYGVFDFFKEYGKNQPYFNRYLGQGCGYTVGLGSFMVARDYMLQSIGSYSDRGDIERIDLGYKTVMPGALTHNMLLPGSPGVRRLDSLYNYKTVYSKGMNNATDSAYLHGNISLATAASDPSTLITHNFSSWRRYLHVMHRSAQGIRNPFSASNDPTLAFLNSSNPYLFACNTGCPTGFYAYQATSGNDLKFDHGFLESEKIPGNLMVPGELYEIKTLIYDNHVSRSGDSVKMCNFDVNIVTGKPRYNTTTGAYEDTYSVSNSVLGSDFSDGSRGFPIFTTFNNPVKWTSYAYNPTSDSAGVVSTSNVFMMPKIPASFTGLNIQVGPANSDHVASLNLMDGANYLSSYSPKKGNAFLGYERARTTAYYGNVVPNVANQLNNPFHKPGYNFGLGLPWFMMGKIYANAADGIESPASSRFRFWWFDANNVTLNSVSTFPNVPTAADSMVQLGAVELVRYSKNPFMLSSVKKYKLNGYASLDTSLHSYVLVSQLDLAYDYKEDSLFNYLFSYGAYVGGTDTTINCTAYHTTTHSVGTKIYAGKEFAGFQNFYLLRSVRQVPVNGANGNAASSYVYGNLPTTSFGYSKLNTDLLYPRRSYPVDADFSGNIHLMTRLTDQLGGIMAYEFYPLSDSTRIQFQAVNVDYSRMDLRQQGYYATGAYATNKTIYRLQVPIKKKFYYNSASATLPVKEWDYDYGDGQAHTACTAVSAIARRNRGLYSSNGPFDHYVTEGNTDVDMGYQYTTVKYPLLSAGATTTPYDIYTYYTTENRGLTFGKLKAIENHDASGLLLSRTDYTYAATMAYPHALLNDNRVASRYANQANLEFTYSVRRHSGGNPANTTSNLNTLNNLSKASVYGNSLMLLDLADTASFAGAATTDNNSYFVRLTAEKHTDYDYQPLTSGNWGTVLTASPLAGVNLGSISLPAPNTSAHRMASAPAISAYSGISALKLGISAGLASQPIGPALNPLLLQNQTSLSTLTQYDYWDCDSLGISHSDGFRYLLNTTPGTTNNLQLTYEPSWELFRKKTSSPDHPNMYKAEEHYFYYDLKQYINAGGFYNSSQFPNYDKFDALKYTQTYRIRSLPYQKREVSKATTSSELQASEYYWYDCKTLSDTVFYYDTVHFSGPLTNCSTHAPPDSTKKVNQGGTLGADGCIPIIHPGLLPPAGYHITDMGGGQYMYCPNPSVIVGRYVNLPNDMSTKLQLRRVTRQVDTLDRRGTDAAFFNKYYRIARFKEATLPGPGSGTHLDYIWCPGFDTLTYYKANRHTALGLVAEDINERGLVTHYYYHPVWNTSFIDNVHPCNNYGAYDLTNQGVPGCVTVGAGRADSLQTCYNYNKDFTVQSITDPNGMSLSYQYDNFSRLNMAFRNGDTLSVNAYSQWMNDTTKSFEDRAAQNYVESFIKLDKNSTVAEHSRAYVDPLGRKYDVQTQVTANYTSPAVYDTMMVHSGLTIYDNWDRVSQQYKPFKYINGGSTVTFAPRFNPTAPYTQQQYEPNQRGRLLRAAKYGQSISTGHTVNSSYQIINGNQLRTEVVNGFYILYALGTVSPASLSGFKFLKTSTIDEDGKKTITYTNAFGQKIAGKTYSNPATQQITGYVYDSPGHLIKVINPQLQYTTYQYNLLGNLYLKASVDADTVKYMYDASGHVVLEEDANARHGQDQALRHKYLRYYKYDAFGRLTEQDRSEYGNYNPLRYAYQPSPDSAHTFYTYSYGSSLDFLGGWQQKRCDFGRTLPPTGSIPPPSPWPHPDPASSYCYYFSLTPYDSLTPARTKPEKKWYYHNPMNGDADLGSSLASYISGTAQTNLKGRLSAVKSYQHNGTFSNLNVYSYNASGWLLSEAAQLNVPGGSTMSSLISYPSYNLRGSLKSQQIDVNLDGVYDMAYTYGYDGWNRLRSVKAKAGAGSTNNLATYAYDDAQGLLTKTQYYDVESGCATPIDTISYAYDTRNRLTGIRGHLYREGLYYDGNHCQQALSPFLVQNDYSYNGNINVASHLYTLAGTYNYAATAGLMDSATVYGYKYDGLNRLSAADASVLNVLTGTAANYTPKLKYGDESYTYDGIGNTKTINRGVYYGPSVVSPANWVQNWKYICSGPFSWNRLTEVDSSNNAALRTYGYDYNGNQVSQTAYTKTYGTSYMRSNLPDTTFSGGLSEIYQYNAGDDRIYKQLSNNAIQTYYLRDMSGKALAEYDFTSSLWKYHAYGKEHIGDYNLYGHFEYAAHDHLGTARAIYTVKTLACSPLNLSYTIINANDVYPYGKALRTYNNTSISEYGYQGSEREHELSKNDYYTHFRGLDADIERWKQTDPQMEDQMNWTPYASMNGNPVRYNDILGNSVEDWFKNLKTGEVVENKNISGNKGDKVSLSGSSDIWENIGKTAMDPDIQKAKASTSDVLLAASGTVAEGGKYLSKLILDSRAGFTSGKLFPYSAKIYSKFSATKINLGARLVGAGLNLWSMRNTEVQYRDGEIGNNRRVFNHLNNTVGLRFPLLGIPIAVGDYYGQKYEQQINNSYLKPEGALYQMTKFMLNIAGIPTGEEKK